MLCLDTDFVVSKSDPLEMRRTEIPLPSAEHLGKSKDKAPHADPNVRLGDVPNEDETDQDVGDHGSIVQLGVASAFFKLCQKHPPASLSGSRDPA